MQILILIYSERNKKVVIYEKACQEGKVSLLTKKPKQMFSCHASFHTEANQAIKYRVHEWQTGYYRSLSITFSEIPSAIGFQSSIGALYWAW